MSRLSLKLTLIASLAVFTLSACGGSPASSVRARYGGIAPRSLNAAPAAPAAQGNTTEDIGKNPFIVWIKQNHPKAAASIINQYLSTGTSPNPDPGAAAQRAQFRQQVIDTVANELLKNLAMGLPKGLRAKVAGPGRVRVSGYQQQMGFDIRLQFEFDVRMDQAGMVWIRVPADRVKAYAESAIVSMLDGDLDDNAYEEIVKNLDEQGPPNARRTPGLTYQRGGVFRLDPGFAFVNMPS